MSGFAKAAFRPFTLGDDIKNDVGAMGDAIVDELRAIHAVMDGMSDRVKTLRAQGGIPLWEEVPEDNGWSSHVNIRFEALIGVLVAFGVNAALRVKIGAAEIIIPVTNTIGYTVLPYEKMHESGVAISYTYVVGNPLSVRLYLKGYAE